MYPFQEQLRNNLQRWLVPADEGVHPALSSLKSSKKAKTFSCHLCYLVFPHSHFLQLLWGPQISCEHFGEIIWYSRFKLFTLSLAGCWKWCGHAVQAALQSAPSQNPASAKLQKRSSWPGCARSKRGCLKWEMFCYDHEPSAAFWFADLWFYVILAIGVSGFAPPAPAWIWTESARKLQNKFYKHFWHGQ